MPDGAIEAVRDSERCAVPPDRSAAGRRLPVTPDGARRRRALPLGGFDRDGQFDNEALCHASRHFAELMDPAVVAEDVVGV